ncbi:hypothetical protein [Candidatus Parabeggiatoa sp. HSG14]|nr:hypothetical protein [Thiotrichales bacterium HSG14]
MSNILAAWLPNPLSFYTFALTVTSYAVVPMALRGFQQLEQCSPQYYY